MTNLSLNMELRPCVRYGVEITPASASRSPFAGPVVPKREEYTGFEVLVRSRAERLQTVRKLNLWGQDLGDASIVSRLPNLQVSRALLPEASTNNHQIAIRKINQTRPKSEFDFRGEKNVTS